MAGMSLRTDKEIAEIAIAEWEYCCSTRGNFESQWEETAARMLPSYVGSFRGRDGNLYTQGEKNTEDMIDATAALAAPKFAAVCEAYLTPRNSTWHGLVALDPVLRRNHQVQLWFDDLTERLFRVRYAPHSGFSGQNHEVFLGMGVFGTGTLFVDKMIDPVYGAGIRYRSIHLAEIYFQSNHQGIIDRAYRRFMLTAEQAYDKWGGKLPRKIVEDATGRGTPEKRRTQYTFIHCVKRRSERDGYDPQRLDARRHPFASYYVSVEEKTLLEERGFGRFPYPISRYLTAPGEEYGRGPGMLCLPTQKILNEQQKAVLKQGHRIADPVILTHDDGIGNGFNLTPGYENVGYISAEGRRLADVLPVGNLAVTREMMNDNRMVVNDAFLVTLFQILMDNPRMTAAEVLTRVQEKGQLISPTVGRQQSEYLAPLIDREIDILIELNMIPPPPPILQQASIEYDVRYDSPLSRAQRAEAAAGGMRVIQWANEWFAATRDPRVYDWINVDTMMPDVADINGMPARWINSPEAVMAQREQRAQQVQIQQVIDAAPAVAGVVKAMPQQAGAV
jgi:hypothetical protein